jgi:hypothetical protein
MSDTQVNLADIEAIGDVLDWLAEQSDSLTVEAAIALAAALGDIGKKVAMAKALCETQAKKLLDGQPIKVGDTVYVEKDTGKWRPNQPRIRNVIVGRSIYDDNGERIDDTTEVARRAVSLMYDMFVSPSQMPKAGAMKTLGIANADVADWEKTGSELKAL